MAPKVINMYRYFKAFIFISITSFSQSYVKYIQDWEIKNFQPSDARRKQMLDDIADWMVYSEADNQGGKLLLIDAEANCISPVAAAWLSLGLKHYGFGTIQVYCAGIYPTNLRKDMRKLLTKSDFKWDGSTLQWVYAGSTTTLDLGPWHYQSAIKKYGEMQMLSLQGQVDTELTKVYERFMSFGLYYDDPKFYEGTPQQAQKYRELYFKIADEMLYLAKSASVYYKEYTKNR